MIKDLKEIQHKELEELSSNIINISEMLDMLYFKIELHSDKFNVLKNGWKPLTHGDLLVSTVNYEISNFSEEIYSSSKKDELLRICGEGSKIGFFYLPVQKTHIIEYPLNARTFILSDLKTNINNDTSTMSITSENALERVYEILKDKVSNIPLVKSLYGLDDEQLKEVRSYCDDKIDGAELIKSICDCSISSSGLAVEDCEGFIIRCKRLCFKVPVVNTASSIDRDSTKMCRDMVIADMLNIIRNNPSVVDEVKKQSKFYDKAYVLFTEYMSKTDIFTRYKMNAEDLLPPCDGHIGDISFKLIDNGTVKTFCQYNEIAKNIFRIIVKAVENHNFSRSESYMLTDADKDMMNSIVQLF